jgi:hypothetical protein
MTEQAPSEPAAQAARRRPSRYRAVLSLGIAAIIAAWLPFSMLYINALTHRVAIVNAIGAVHSVSATSSHSPTTPTLVTTRTS